MSTPAEQEKAKSWVASHSYKVCGVVSALLMVYSFHSMTSYFGMEKGILTETTIA